MPVESTKLRVAMASSISAIIISVITAGAALYRTEIVSNDESRATDFNYVSLAMQILASNPHENYPNLRQWAVDVVKKGAPVEIGEDLESELVKGGIAISKIGSDAKSASGGVPLSANEINKLLGCLDESKGDFISEDSEKLIRELYMVDQDLSITPAMKRQYLIENCP